jgi:hypothetical protein
LLSPPNRFDASVKQAFHRNQEKRESDKKIYWGSMIFRQFVISKPVFALFAVLITALLCLAFQLGRVSVLPAQLPALAKNSDEVPQKVSAELAPPTKVIEVPVTKIVKVPVIKEKVITRFVYFKGRNYKKNEIKNIEDKSQSDNFKLINSVAENGYMTQTSLKGFKPKSEIKMEITKQSKAYEK